VSWNDVIDAQSNAQDKALVQSKLQQLGFNNNDLAGSTSGVANVNVNAKIPVFAYGVTDKLTVAVAIPVVSIDVNADTGLVKSQQGQQFTDSINDTDPNKGNEVAGKLNDAINAKLKRLGYDPITSYNKTEIGDIKAVGKYRVYNGESDAVTVRSEVTLPTGVAPNADRALDTPTGDGQWDLGASLLYDHYLDRAHLVRVNAYAGYTAQLPDHIDRRLPVSNDESLSVDKENVYRDLGDIFSAGAAFVYEFPFGLNASAGYSFQRMGGTHYEGTRFDPYRYSLLEALQPMQMLHAATFTLGYSTVEMFKQGRFKAPFQVNLAYSVPLAGLNVVRNDFMSFELVLFF
jgi:hypothetical protein